MEYRTLGRSGCVVSTLALGSMTFGAETDEPGAQMQLDRFVADGGTLIDTADVYSDGAAEAIIGRWLSARPSDITDRLVLATKGRFSTAPDPNGLGSSRRHLERALEASLRRLGVSSVDLYQVHAWDPVTPIEETLAFLDDAARAGKIRYVGLSNFTGWQIQKAVDVAEHRGLARPITVQPQYNLLVREIEWEIMAACVSEGLGLLPWSPLGGGWLTGKYRRDQRPTGPTRLGENPNVAWRPTIAAADRSAHGPWLRPSGISPKSGRCPWPKSRWPGSSTGPQSHRSFSAPAPWTNSTTTWRRPTCASRTRKPPGWMPPVIPKPLTTPTEDRRSNNAAAPSSGSDRW